MVVADTAVSFCPSCGSGAPTGAAYCARCGEALMPAVTRKRGVNGLAIASMVLGILWLYFVGSVLAIIFGYIARNQIKDTPETGDGMAQAGIVLGWVGVGILLAAVLIAVIVPNISYLAH